MVFLRYRSVVPMIRCSRQVPSPFGEFAFFPNANQPHALAHASLLHYILQQKIRCSAPEPQDKLNPIGRIRTP